MNAPKVKVYSTLSCPYCIMEKQWLDNNKISHEVVYVDLDQNAARKMVEETGQMGVPVTEIQTDSKKEFVIGFDTSRLSSLLGITK
jgi:glutaredoxin